MSNTIIIDDDNDEDFHTFDNIPITIFVFR